MPDLVLDLLKYVLLAVLYIFLAWAVRAVYLELRPRGPARAPARASATPPPRAPAKKSRKSFRKVAVVENEKLRGKTFDLSDELVIGRAERCHIVLDDSYASQMHARIFSRGDAHVVEDLGSTNGTYLNRRRITEPTELSRGDRVKIGKTVLEMRK